MSEEGEREVNALSCLHYLSRSKARSQLLFSIVSHNLVNSGFYGWQDFRGWDEEASLNKGWDGRWHRLMDDSTLLSLTCGWTLDVPGLTLAWRALLTINQRASCLAAHYGGSDTHVLPQCLLPLQRRYIAQWQQLLDWCLSKGAMCLPGTLMDSLNGFAFFFFFTLVERLFSTRDSAHTEDTPW